jgi:hypothetical protein
MSQAAMPTPAPHLSEEAKDVRCLSQRPVQLARLPVPPLAVGFMGLGTGYLIYGTQELFGYPKAGRGRRPGDRCLGIWMPGFMQFITGVYLLAGLTLFGTFTAAPPLYMAALAFTAYGVHWFALGWIRLRGADARANIGMTVAFLAISVLGCLVFFKAGDDPVGGLFIGLICVYVTEFFATLGIRRAEPEPARYPRTGLLPPRHRGVADVPDVRDRAQLRAEVHAAAMSGQLSARSTSRACARSSG